MIFYFDSCCVTTSLMSSHHIHDIAIQCKEGSIDYRMTRGYNNNNCSKLEAFPRS